METRLRQVALVAPSIEPWATALRSTFGLREPYRDVGVSAFGLENVVFEVGQSFLEVVAPVETGTTAGRLIEKQGGAGGYMAIFQVDDLDVARKHIESLGVRVVWQADLDDVAGTHLHPKDVPGAIVSVDWASPPESWRWGGPRWTGTAPDGAEGGLDSITVAVHDPGATAQRWAEVLDADAEGDSLRLGSQTIAFVSSTGTSQEGIVDVCIRAPDLTPGEVRVGNVTVRVGRGDE